MRVGMLHNPALWSVGLPQDFDALALTADTWIEAHGDLPATEPPS